MLFISSTIFNEMVFADNIVTSSERLDISSGEFGGKRAEYYFKIPNAWQGYVYVNRIVTGEDDLTLLEHVNFYCISESGMYKPVLMFSLYVFSQKQWRDYYPFDILVQNATYVYAVDYSNTQGFRSSSDQKIFRAVWDHIKTPEKIRNLIILPDDDSSFGVRRIYVGNVAIDDPPELIEGIYYVPIRVVAETLGYKVNWLQYNSTVEILRANTFYDQFKVTASTKTDDRGFKIRLINDRTFVQTAYVSQILKRIVEIDEHGNIYISR